MENCPNCAQSKKLISEWLEQQGHERCWYYPDIFTKLAKLFGLVSKKAPKLPPRQEFEAGCKRYQDEEYGH